MLSYLLGVQWGEGDFMYNIYLLAYNNYLNRIVKKPYENLATYLDSHDYQAFFGINFNPNDGVDTTQIMSFYPTDFVPNYLIAEDAETHSYTKWFIVEQRRTRGGQYQLTLKRDILSDFYTQTKSAISFITKGFVSAENALIFNSENVLVNQIKKAEIPLRDSSRCAWIVGYLAPNLAESEDYPVEVNYEQEVIPDISEFDYADYVGQEIKGLINTTTSYYALDTRRGASSTTVVTRYLNNTGEAQGIGFGQAYPIGTIFIKNKTTEQVVNLSMDIDENIFNTLISNHLQNDDYLEILSLKNKIYKDGDIYKKVVITPKESEYTYDINVNTSNAPNVYQAITNKLTELGCEYEGGIGGGGAYDVEIPTRIIYSSFILTLEEVGSPITTAKVTFKSTIKQLKDAPYKMFCIPVSDNAILRVGNTDISMDKDKMIQIASSIATGLKTDTQGFLYDLQLMPYCPMEDKFSLLTNINGNEYIGGGTEHIDYDVIRDSSDNPIAYMFYCDRSSFTTNITAIGSLNYPSLSVNDPIEFKTKNETYMFRIVSPNYANFEDFNYFKNYGINYFNVDCTYKPLTPYVKLNINYKGLYGADYNDQRGLILGGDYSLPIISDQWINYQIQNKNYANIFERENQNLEYKHKWGMASAVSGAAVGTAAGFMLGGPGGAIGAAAAGSLDLISKSALHGEQMDYRRDMFNFNIQNIQALPQGLVKTSALNYNSKIWPFVEIYNCTEEETEAVRNKIIYNGMTLNIVGKIEDYLNANGYTYIQGRIIRIQINEDSHMVAAINSELNMGVYYE